MIRPTIKSDHDALIALVVDSGLFEPDQTELLSDILRSSGEEDVWFTDDDGTGPVGVAYLAPEKMTYGTLTMCGRFMLTMVLKTRLEFAIFTMPGL
ncbi:MAG: hypothetical protein AAF579_23470, partial [Cyanobacteria bacterium P01_C01_bin.118]